jgi:DNA-binding transcriptional MerR regulator
MPQAGVRNYRIREFAKLAGVTVRALQHYDRMGILTPARSQTGSRVYSASDLQALAQIVALKSVGVPLKKIGALRASGPTALAETLGTERRALERKQPVLDRVIFAVRNLEAVLNRGGETNAAELRPLMDALRSGEGSKSPQAVPARSRPGWVELKQRWQVLLADIQNAPSADPEGPLMQQLAARWERLMALSTDGASFAADLAPHAELLRTVSVARGVPGSGIFERIGPALANRVAPSDQDRSAPRHSSAAFDSV